MINLDKYESIGSHWIDFYVKVKNATYFDNFRVKHIPKKIENSLAIRLFNKYL